MLKSKMIQKKLLFTLLIIVLGFIWINSMEITISSRYQLTSIYDRAYTIDVENNNYQSKYKLYTSVPQSLYEYYHSKSHSLNGDNDYSKFITPEAVKTIAEKIQGNTHNGLNSNEEFANNVLALVHQIPYSISNRKYPVETIADNSGDCDTLSFLAASIMKAGNLDVVLFIYRDLPITHMNIGVNLPYSPTFGSFELGVNGFEFNNKTYWVAECTPSGNWKVGNQPESFSHSVPTIISIENYEKSSPADISASLYNPLIPSTVSISLSSEKLNTTTKGLSLIISGSILPAHSGKKIVMYINRAGSFYETFPITTRHLGSYSLSWNTSSFGTYYIKTSLIGFSDYASSDSETITVYVGNTEPDEKYTNFGSRNYNVFFNSNTNDVLKSNFTGTNVSLTGEFIILKNGSTLTHNQQQITYPERIIRSRRGSVLIPERTITIKGSKQETNHFGFILKNNDGNFSASVELLMENDLSIIENQFKSNYTTFMDVSASIKENIWYKAALNITDSGITTELQIKNSTFFETIISKRDSNVINESIILISSEPNTIIAFKNLKTESLDQQSDQPTSDTSLLTHKLEPFSEYFSLLIPLLIVVGGIFLKRKKGKRKQVMWKKNN